ncbi:MAG: hypothetical protein ACLFT7_04565 [Thermoplasmata archaeon]
MVLSMIEFLAGVDELLLNPTEGNVLFGIFFFFMAKSATETLEGVLRDGSQKHFFSSPVESDSIFYSKFVRIWLYNLLLFGIAMMVVSFVVKTWHIELPVDRNFIIVLYLVVILAPLIGFNSSILLHVEDKRLKILNGIISGVLIALTGLILHSRADNLMRTYYITSMIVGALVISTFSSRVVYREVWTNSSQNSEGSIFHDRTLALPNFITKTTRLIAESELTRRWRRRQVPSSLIVVSIMGAGLGFFYWSLGPSPNIGLGMDEYFYPALIAMTAFIAAIIHVLIPSLDLFSRDGKRLWCLRSFPKDLDGVVKGKTLAILIPAPMITVVIALPLPLILGYPITYIFLSVMGSLTIIFLMSGIGIWAAAKFPNFNESTKGAPDIITMYSTVMLGLFLSGLFLAVPLFFLEINVILSALTIVFSTSLAVLFMVLMIKRSSAILKRMEFSF